MVGITNENKQTNKQTNKKNKHPLIIRSSSAHHPLIIRSSSLIFAHQQLIISLSSATHQFMNRSSSAHYPLIIFSLSFLSSSHCQLIILSSSAHYPFKDDQLFSFSAYRFPHGSKSASSLSVLCVEVLLPSNSASSKVSSLFPYLMPINGKLKFVA